MKRTPADTPSSKRRDRLNWGPLLKLPTDQAIKTVRAWLKTHKPDDPGYKGALRWVIRQETYRDLRARQLPQLERIGREMEQERLARRAKPPEPEGEDNPFVIATPKKRL